MTMAHSLAPSSICCCCLVLIALLIFEFPLLEKVLYKCRFYRLHRFEPVGQASHQPESNLTPWGSISSSSSGKNNLSSSEISRKRRRLTAESDSNTAGGSSTSPKLHCPLYEDPLTSTVNCTCLLSLYRNAPVEAKMSSMLYLFGQHLQNYQHHHMWARRVLVDPPFWVSLHNREFDPVRWSVFEQGKYYEQAETRAFQDIFKEEKERNEKNNEINKVKGTVIDVGGNIGWFSLLSQSHGHPIETFEPNLANVLRICESLELNGWSSESTSARIHHSGLSDSNQIERFFTRNNPGKGNFHQVPRNREDLRRKRQGIAPTIEEGGVRVQTLDLFAERQNWFATKHHILLLKVDVEGFEPFVFGGSSKLLQSGQVENILMELSPALGRKKKRVEKNRETLLGIIKAGFVLHKWGTDAGPDKDLKVDPNKDLATQLMDMALSRRSKQINLWWKWNGN